MTNPICKKIISMLSLYIENKLEQEDRLFIENHFLTCKSCYTKYLEMKDIIENLHFEYEKLLNEFEKIEANNVFNIREYEMFYSNISPYIDDELCYDESIKFRKYLLKSKPARNELANAYNLKNNIKNSVADFKENMHINFSKSIIKRLENENNDNFDQIYKKAAVVLGFLLSALIGLMGFNYISEAFIGNEPQNEVPVNNIETVNFPDDADLVEFTFDENQEALLTLK